MNSIDSGKIVQLMHDVHLAVAVAFYEGDNQLIVDYSDMKPHRNGEPRTLGCSGSSSPRHLRRR